MLGLDLPLARAVELLKTPQEADAILRAAAAQRAAEKAKRQSQATDQKASRREE